MYSEDLLSLDLRCKLPAMNRKWVTTTTTNNKNIHINSIVKIDLFLSIYNTLRILCRSNSKEINYVDRLETYVKRPRCDKLIYGMAAVYHWSNELGKHLHMGTSAHIPASFIWVICCRVVEKVGRVHVILLAENEWKECGAVDEHQVLCENWWKC